MANYQIGNIMLSFKVQSNNISNSVNRIIKSFDKLNNINLSGIKRNFDGLTQAITPFLDKIKSAEPALKSFVNSLDFQKTYLQFEKINAQLEKVKNNLGISNEKLQQAKLKTQALVDKNTQNALKIENAKVKLQKSNAQLEITNARLNKIKNTANKTSTSFSKIFNLGRIYFWINYTKRVAQAIGNMMTSAINFNETLNKFQVSMGDYYSQSIKFVNSLTYAFNLSTESIMNYQATFKNMLDAIGGLGESGISYQLSETLTRMAIDYASLFNVSIDRAMEQFQSTLSGQIRSIRTTSGYDVSEASIYALYQSIGGTKTMRQLDQVEKRLLRILAIQQQMSNTGAVNDFAKTLNSSANVLKQMSETWKEIGRWVGQLTMVYLEPFLEKFLGFSVALREILKSMNVARGYEYENLGKGGVFGQIEESAESAEEAVENLKSVLLGFDKLNILGSNTGNSVLGGAIPDYSLITDQIAKYETKLDEVKNDANEIAEKILEWLGYHKEINEYVDEQGEKVENVVWVLDEGITKLDIIKGTILTIGGIITASSIVKTINRIVTFITGLSVTAQTILSTALSIAGVVAGIVLAVKTAYENNEEFRESLDETFQTFKDTGVIENFQGLLYLLKQIGNYLKTDFSESIGYSFKGVIDLINTIILLLQGDFKGALESYGKVWEDMWKGFDAAFGTNLFKFFTETIPHFFKVTIPQAWNDFTDWLSTIPTWLYNNVWVKIANFGINVFAELVNGIISAINGITESLSSIWDWTGIPAIPEIPKWQPTLIAMQPMANGGVVTSPTPALIGEYAGAKTNPEIVTPERLMREVFIDSMLPLVQAVVSGNAQVVQAIQENGQQPIELNGRKVSEAIYDDLRNVAIRKGNDLSFAR